MATTVPHTQDIPESVAMLDRLPVLRIYSHSNFFYWWPVWLTGFIMALVTRLDGKQITEITGRAEWFHPDQAPGLIFLTVLFLTILFTNVILRGMASVVTVLTVALVVVLLAYFDLWEPILSWLPELLVHMNMGFYVVFSLLLLIVWLFTFFFFDRLTYWSVRPGQIVEHLVIGGSARSFDTHGMVFEKAREDWFRHLILGLGSGDIKIFTTGARREEISVPNVLFVDRKVRAIQRLIAVQPEDLQSTA
jgi:hypothetical protein